jgi:hypothetical protein
VDVDVQKSFPHMQARTRAPTTLNALSLSRLHMLVLQRYVHTQLKLAVCNSSVLLNTLFDLTLSTQGSVSWFLVEFGLLSDYRNPS